VLLEVLPRYYFKLTIKKLTLAHDENSSKEKSRWKSRREKRENRGKIKIFEEGHFKEEGK